MRKVNKRYESRGTRDEALGASAFGALASSYLLTRTSLLFILLVCGCKTQKDHLVVHNEMVDSVAMSVKHRTIESLDSTLRSTSFDFDTLEVRIERYISVADTAAIKPEVFQLRAIKGRMNDIRSSLNQQREAYNQLDTLAYKKSSAEQSTEHTATTRVYSPPDGTVIFALLLLLAAVVAYLFLQKKLD